MVEGSLRQHSLDCSPHSRFSSRWCPRCTEIGLHPSNADEIEAVLVAAARQETAQLAIKAVEDERMPQPRSAPYWSGYNAAICDALDAVAAALARETGGEQ